MINEYSLKIFRFLWEHSDEQYSIAEISKGSKVSYGETWKVLKEFKNRGIVDILVKKAHLYRLNLDSELCFKTWELWNSIRKQEFNTIQGYGQYSEAMNYLAKKIPNQFMALFGSVARKDATMQSDLDVLVLTKRGFNPSNTAKEIKIRYFIDIKITAVTEKELQKYLEQKREVYRQIWFEGIVWNGTKEYYIMMRKMVE